MIPNKSNFKFQELTPITGVKPYVIRYWETEFSEISPITSDSGQKIYARKDLEAILKIKKLLFEDKMTIPEARLKMSSLADESEFLPLNLVQISENPSGARLNLEEAINHIKEIRSKRNW
jgi:DNA-binding transcriptional MerR regulator